MKQMHASVAEQTSRNRFWQPAPLPLREIVITIRLQIGEEDGADVGISAEYELQLPESWDDSIRQRIYDGVHDGLTRVGAPLPDGGVGVRIMQLRVSPPLNSSSDSEDVRRVGEMLESQTAATVAALWSGLISLGASAA